MFSMNISNTEGFYCPNTTASTEIYSPDQTNTVLVLLFCFFTIL